MFKSFCCADTRRISGKNGRVPGTASLVTLLVRVPAELRVLAPLVMLTARALSVMPQWLVVL